MVTISELMTKKLVTVPAGTSAADAARVMNERRVGSVFIEQNDCVVGIVTESDIVRKVVGAIVMKSAPPSTIWCWENAVRFPSSVTWNRWA